MNIQETLLEVWGANLVLWGSILDIKHTDPNSFE